MNSINSAESFIGNLILNGKDVYLPLCNVHVMENSIPIQYQSKYIKKCVLKFLNVSNLSLEHEARHYEQNKITECYGGTHFLLNIGIEYWITYSKGFVCAFGDIEYSDKPFMICDDIKNFLGTINLTI